MQITGIDPNPEMASYAMKAAESAQLDMAQMSLLQGTAEQLPVQSQSQDAVVCTLVSYVCHARYMCQASIHGALLGLISSCNPAMSTVLMVCCEISESVAAGSLLCAKCQHSTVRSATGAKTRWTVLVH